MKNNKILLVAAILSLSIPFNMFGMPKNLYSEEPKARTPETEIITDNRAKDYDWVWLSDELCVRTQRGSHIQKARENLVRSYELGMIGHWYDSVAGKIKTRDTYTGTWSQDKSGIWSFAFDDYTIPVGLTKIDGVLYAFTGQGELKEGYEYWNGQKTGTNGVVTENSEEFLTYLGTQYLPECTTQRAEAAQ